MKTCILLATLCVAVAQTSLAEAHERRVLIKAIDRDTKEPVEGASLKTMYFLDETNSENPPATSTAKTNSQGLAVLVVHALDDSDPRSKYGKYTPSYRLEIRNDKYETLLAPAMPPSNHQLMARTPEFIPKEPDIVIEIGSKKAAEEYRKNQIQENAKNELMADEIVRTKPTFWPEQDAESIELRQLVVKKRWELANASLIRSPEDVPDIERIVKKHMNRENSTVRSPKFLNKDTAMVDASYYSGPTGAARYTYVVVRIDNVWTVIRSYNEWIS